MELNPRTTAVLACHFLHDIVGAGGAMAPFFRAEVERRGVVPAAVRLTTGAREAGAQVVLTRVAFPDADPAASTNIPLLALRAQQNFLVEGTPGSALVDEIQPGAGDWVLTNSGISAFAGSDLDSRLRDAGIDTLVLLGVATNITVESTGRAAGDLGYRVVIAEDACAAATQATHDATLASFELLGEVSTVEEILAAL